MYINFSDIPGHQNLFLDYMYEFQNVEKFFGIDFRDEAKYEDHFRQLAASDYINREELLNIIDEQYEEYSPSKLTRQNIESLGEKNCIAVVTGQQLGLFGGPLYTLYKTITTIKLARQLKEHYPAFNFVPVFWLEGDDHDFEEIRGINIPDAGNNLSEIKYSDGVREEVNRGSTAYIKFNKNINSVIEELDSLLRDNDFKDDVFSLIKKGYKTGTTFESAFRNLMFSLFDEYGLILFNANYDRAKLLVEDVFRHEIKNYRKHTDILVARSAELEEIYHAQVKVKPLNMFLIEDDGRYSLEPDGKEFKLKYKRKRFTEEELLNILEEAPEKFSPNVLLRPIVQDSIFPTGFYVGGPGEISYFAQVLPLYDLFGIKAPIIYPRASATILEKNALKIMDKFDLSLTDLFIEERLLTGKIMSGLSEFNLEEKFDSFKNDVGVSLDRLAEILFSVDKTLKDVTEKTRQKMYQNIDNLKTKSLAAEERNYNTALQQISKLRNNLFPGETLQERKYNFIYFAHKYGLSFNKWIFEELNINSFEHQIMKIQ